MKSLFILFTALTALLGSGMASANSFQEEVARLRGEHTIQPHDSRQEQDTVIEDHPPVVVTPNNALADDQIFVFITLSSVGIALAGAIFVLQKCVKKRLAGWLCKNCGYIGGRKRIWPGSSAIELILWVSSVILGLRYTPWFFALGIIYSLWRTSSQYYICPECEQKGMIPTHSKNAIKLMKDSGII